MIGEDSLKPKPNPNPNTKPNIRNIKRERTFPSWTTKLPKPTIPYATTQPTVPHGKFVANYTISLPFIAEHVIDKKLVRCLSCWYDLGFIQLD